MEEKEQLLKDTINRTQKTIETQAGALFNNYDNLINLLFQNKPLLEQFKKSTKDYDSLQFYLNEVTQPDLLTITTKYAGIDVATITITKDKTTISTETQDTSNKEHYVLYKVILTRNDKTTTYNTFMNKETKETPKTINETNK